MSLSLESIPRSAGDAPNDHLHALDSASEKRPFHGFLMELDAAMPGLFSSDPRSSELSSEERSDLVKDAIGCGAQEGDIEHRVRLVLSLFNPKADYNDKAWLNRVAIALDDPRSTYFAQQLSHIFFVEAADLGNSAAYYNLALGYERGDYGPANADMSNLLHWKATKLGHGCAAAQVFSIADPASNNTGATPWSIEEGMTLLRMAAPLFPYAGLALARCEMSGWGTERNRDDALNRLIDVIYSKEEGRCQSADPKAPAAIILAFRMSLGWDLDLSDENVQNVLTWISDESHNPDIRYRLSNFRRRLTYLTRPESLDEASSPEANGTERERERAYVRDLLTQVYREERSFEHFEHAIREGVIEPTEALNSWLWVAATLAKMEGSPDTHSWFAAWQTLQLKRRGVSDEAFKASNEDLGRTFNVLSEASRPIPGLFLKPPALKEAGWRNIGKVDGLSNGSVVVQEAPTAAGPVVVFPEDLDVAMALVFGRPNETLWPSISIEPLDLLTAERERWSFNRKEWTPPWLGHTGWGKTLYAVDKWLGRMRWGWAWPEDCEIAPQDKELVEELDETFRLAGGRRDGMWSRVMLETKWVNQTVTRSKTFFSGETFTCTVHGVRMAVLGADCVDLEDGSSDRSMNVNNNAYAAGRIANILTDRYDDVARLFPAYERARQLSALLYALVGLKEAGFTPKGKTAAKLSADLARWEALPPQSPSSVIVD